MRCFAANSSFSGIGASPPPKSPVPARMRAALSAVPSARYRSCTLGSALWNSSIQAAYNGSGMLEPVATSVIVSCPTLIPECSNDRLSAQTPASRKALLLSTPTDELLLGKQTDFVLSTFRKDYRKCAASRAKTSWLVRNLLLSSVQICSVIVD